MLSAKQIRNGFIDFFKSKGHEFVPSSPIVPIGDESLLFANAGMNQFKDIFIGLVPPQYPRVANTQKCLRVSGKHNDLEEVGKDTYHHTFFEMLGNWSFDDYFKAEAIQWAWELLTDVWGIEPDRLWVTVFGGDHADGLPEDEEAANLWTKVTPIPAEKVLACGKKDNFWEMGETGPCGPCSEIHIDLGPEMCDMKNVPGHKCRVNAGCARYIELWNLVFIQFNRLSEDKLVPLSARYVDTGAGLERIVAVLQNKKSNYDTDLFMPIINYTSDITGHKYTSKLGNKTDNAFRVIADHIRSLVFAITDGAIPSNEGRGYVIRRILRRASRFGRELGMHEPFIYKLVPVVVDCLGDAFGEIRERADYVSTVIESEETGFGRTLDRGIEIFNTAAKRAQQSIKKIINGEDAFQLYDTYGFPLDLTELMAKERRLKVDTAKFDELMEAQRQRARAAQKNDSLMAALTNTELPVTEDAHKYDTDSCDSKLIGWLDNGGFKNQGQIETNTEVGIILDRTCFYAEAGGQVGDCGIIKSDNAQFIVEATAKIANCIIHQGKVVEGSFSVGENVKAIISKDRAATKKNHTATHLLQWALQEVLGKSVAQQGSFVGPDYLRFDFTYPKAPIVKELKKVGDLVREKIAADLPVTWTVMPIDQAQKLGAMALFGEKYGNEVRVVAIGGQKTEDRGQRTENLTSDFRHLTSAFSCEFCGGTHVYRLGSIGDFKIIKEESVSAGVRRITALTGPGLNAYFEKASDIVDELSVMLKAPSEALVDRVNQLIKDNKKLSKELRTAAKASGSDAMAEAKQLLQKCEKINESSIIIGRLQATRIEQAREAVDMLKKKAKSAAIVLGFGDDDKATLLAGMTDDLIKKGLKAGDIVKAIAPIIDGGGGGRPQMAQAGGKNPKKINDALKKAAELINEKLT
ncbi:MAG: alanine--tRNA ligase, partial [Planctomycetes bacterium]|nr:alanine--tRNA ligase [Planctomycetota bacterium]